MYHGKTRVMLSVVHFCLICRYMKKVFLLYVVLMATNSAMAQEFRIGPTAGVNVNIPKDNDPAMGFHLGACGELGIPYANKGLFLDFELLLTSKRRISKKYYDVITGQGKHWKTNSVYMEVPLRFGYRFTFNERFNIFASAGPYIGLGLFGKNKVITEEPNAFRTTTVSNNIFSSDDQKRFDWGVGLRLGAEIRQHYQISFGSDWGLCETNSLGDKNRIFAISLCYLF